MLPTTSRRPRHGQGRGTSAALRTVRRALSDRRVGHAQVLHGNGSSGARMPQAIAAVNDFVVKFANVNGSGSASANELFARSILRMGVPVSPRTSSIEHPGSADLVRGARHREELPGRRGGVDMMVAMKPADLARTSRRSSPAATCSTTAPSRCRHRRSARTSTSSVCR